MKTFFYYLCLGFELVGLFSVGLCFITGLKVGDYGKLELLEFLGGSILFYSGHFIRSRFIRI